MSLIWLHWYQAITPLRPAFSRHLTFLWFVVGVAGMSIRQDNLGVTSLARALALRTAGYESLLGNMHSPGICLSRLTHCWVRCVFQLFGSRIERVNDRVVLIADGKKIAKQGRKMPAVKCLHQESDNHSKPAFIMGHSTQAVSLLVNAVNSAFAVPLDIKIHEGLVFSNRSKQTLLDKLIGLIGTLDLPEHYYLVADAYYASGAMVNSMLDTGNHLITRVRSNSVAYHPAPVKSSRHRKRGRPRKYGKKVRLVDLFRSATKIYHIPSPVYAEKSVTLKVRQMKLYWRPSGALVNFVLVDHPRRGRIMLMCTDLDLELSEVIRLYGLRFKIEFGFKQASQVIGAFDYHFWMMEMTPQRRWAGNQHLHKKSEKYRNKVREKIHAYHVHLFIGVVAQGLMQYLSVCHTELVWRTFGSWLRTIRQGIPPSERIVAMALRNCLPHFLVDNAQTCNLAKFIIENQDPDRADNLGNAA